MHKEILTKEQLELLPLIKEFSEDFVLVGGTAIAFHIGHRRSIDFDLFNFGRFNNLSLKSKISKHKKIDKVIVNKLGEFTISIKGVKFTFFQYPYKIKSSKNIDDIVRMPDLLTLATMKAFALGMRAKWKDYVDLYFIIKDHYSLEEISKKAEQIFGNEFNEKLLRVQLSYFKDVDYKEKVIFMPGFEVSENTIKKKLIKFSLS